MADNLYKKRYLYRIYGLNVSSNIHLPLDEIVGRFCLDVHFSLKTDDEATERSPQRAIFIAGRKKWNRRNLPGIFKINESYLLKYYDLMDFYISEEGQTIRCYRKPGISIEHVWGALLGPAFSFVLNLREIFNLHSSGVALDGQAIGFTGPPGAGKSTLATCFLKWGASLITDDILPLKEARGKIYAVPAFARVRIWPDTLSHLIGGEVEFPRVIPEAEKRRLEINQLWGTFCQELQPLRTIYILEPKQNSQEDVKIKIVPLSKKEAIIALLTDTFFKYTVKPEIQVYQLRFYSQVVSCVSIKRVIFPRSLDFLSSLHSAILGDFTGESASIHK